MKELLKLTEQQKSIWNTEIFYSGTSINNIGGYIYIKQKVDFDILTKTVNLYVKHNDNARIHFISKDNEIYQFVSEYKEFSVDITDVKNIEEIKKFATKALNKPFENFESDLFKFHFFKLPNGNGGLTITFHHLLNDAWGMGLFITRIIEIYTALLNGKSEFDDYPKYSEYIKESNNYKDSKKFIKDKEYWEKTFENEPNLTFIDKNKKKNLSPLDTIKGAREKYNIDKQLSKKIDDYCKKNNVSFYTFFMAIYLLYLAKINDSQSAILGTPVLNRSNFNEKQISRNVCI